MHLARGFAHQSGITTACKRVHGTDAVLRGSVNRITERPHATSSVGKFAETLAQFLGMFDQEPVRFKQIDKDALRHPTFSLVRTKMHMAAVSDATADTGTPAWMR